MSNFASDKVNAKFITWTATDQPNVAPDGSMYWDVVTELLYIKQFGVWQALETGAAGAPINSPHFTGIPTAPTAAALTDNTQLATTAYTDSAVAVETAARVAAGYAPLVSPAFTGTPTAPTKAPLTDNTDIATTAYTDLAVGVETSRATTAEGLLAPLASPTFTGTVNAANITATGVVKASGFTDTPIAAAVNFAIPPNTSATYVITKASMEANTLAAPTVGTSDGVTIIVTSNTAFAHTITATGLLQTGAATVNVATFAANAGASVTLMAYQGKWNVISQNAVTFS